MEVVLRVDQLDASELDQNIADILQHQFLQIFTPLESLRIQQLEPELKALIRFLLWKYSLGTGDCTFGQRMLSLTYTQSSRTPVQKAGLFFTLVVTEWLMDRGDWLSSKFPTIAPLHKWLEHSTTALKLLSLLNFIVFLIQGCYPTLKERLLGLQLVPTRPQTLRDVSHSYMTREIMWHGFSEFLFFILPHFNLFALWSRIKRLCSTVTTDHQLCAFCETTPTMPHLSNCGHMYCYYCLAANLKANSKFSCFVCNQQVLPYTAASQVIT